MSTTKKRVNAYTSTSIGKDKVPVLNELQAYIKDTHGQYVTHQQIIDLAVQQAADNRATFAKTLVVDEDPRLKAFLRLQAELKAEGKI